jgi:hypothetical protein
MASCNVPFNVLQDLINQVKKEGAAGMQSANFFFAGRAR